MKPLQPSEWAKNNLHVVAAMQNAPLNIHGQLAHHPDLLDAWWNYRQYVVQGGKLTPRQSEIVVLKVAALTGTWYEWASHVVRGMNVGLTLAEIERIARPLLVADWSSDEALLIRAVQELTASGRIEPSTLQDLEKTLSTQQILDVIAIQGVYLSLANILNTWETELDPAVASQLPESVTRRAFENLLASDAQ